MTTFLLIRHAERSTPPEILAGRAASVLLTPDGTLQAERIARHLAPVHIDQIYSSPLERAIETAAPLAREKQLQVTVEAAFSEIDFGAWTKRPIETLEGDAHWRQFNQFRSGTRIPGGEVAIEVQQRFVCELLNLREQFPEQTIAIVSHGDPIRLAIGYFIGLPVDLFARLEVSMASITTLEIAPWGPRLIRLNEVPGADDAR